MPAIWLEANQDHTSPPELSVTYKSLYTFYNQVFRDRLRSFYGLYDLI